MSDDEHPPSFIPSYQAIANDIGEVYLELELQEDSDN